MAQEEKNRPTSYRFLLDAKNSRQYVIGYNGDQPKLPFHVFAENSNDGGFQPNETIFALDDTKEIGADAEGVPVLSTLAYQITVPDHADPSKSGWHVEQSEVFYHIGIKPGLNGPILFYQMTPESVQSLDEQGFELTYPTYFEDSLIIEKSPFGNRLPLTMLEQAPFPPNHYQGAFLAHDYVNKLPPSQLPAARTPGGVSGSFKTATDKPVRYRHSDTQIESLIRQYCKDLTAQAAEGRLDPVVGREAETDQALKVLTRRKQSSLCFTGEAGVGKSAMFYAIAQRIVDDKDLPESLQNARVLSLDLQSMNAGAMFRGQFEGKLKPLIDGLQERGGILNGRKVIFAIDEIHSQLSSGKTGSDSNGAGEMMKDFMVTQGISVMGTTTDEEYKKHIEANKALSRRFEKMRLLPPNEEDTVTIMKRLWPLIKAHNNLTVDLADEDIRYIVTMSNRYAPQEVQPSKSEKVIMMAAASAEFGHRTEINKTDILSAIAQMSNLPLDFLNQSDHERFLKLEKNLPEAILGQPNLERVVNGLIGARSGLADPNQPWGCFVLQGPTGTGKTELCKEIARQLFGTEDAMIKLDMGEYAEKHSVARLIGAPPGYVGFDSAEPALTEKIRQRPYTVLLLDEIEKAHPDVYNVLLPVLNDGKTTDNHGNTVLFNNVIVFMTTNAGAAEVMALLEGKTGMGLGSGKQDSTKTTKELETIYAKARRRETGGPFRPEIINRIDELGGFVTFLPLEPEVVSELALREVAKVNKRLNNTDGANLKNVTIETTPEVMAELAKQGYNRAMGARPLRKVVREKIANPLGKWLMGNKEAILAKVAAEGPQKIVISSLTDFAPELVAAAPTPVLANDNAAAPAPASTSTPAKKPLTPSL